MRSRMTRMILAAIITLAPALLVLVSSPASATAARWNRFSRQHPRRYEVNQRLGNQQARINQGLKSGKLTPTQAKQLEANDHSIKRQERADVKANGGFLTKGEQKQLNQEENANSTLIRDDKNPAPK